MNEVINNEKLCWEVLHTASYLKSTERSMQDHYPTCILAAVQIQQTRILSEGIDKIVGRLDSIRYDTNRSSNALRNISDDFFEASALGFKADEPDKKPKVKKPNPQKPKTGKLKKSK
jgi:hypothetical protein